jgi:uncharacterized coiled-coil DUF342 family protein
MENIKKEFQIKKVFKSDEIEKKIFEGKTESGKFHQKITKLQNEIEYLEKHKNDLLADGIDEFSNNDYKVFENTMKYHNDKDEIKKKEDELEGMFSSN